MNRLRRMTALCLVLALALTLSPAVAAADAQKEPVTGILTRQDDSDFGVLKITAPEGNPAYVKILRYDTETGKNKKTPVRTLYIRAGKSLTMDMPSGEYTLRYATGTTWYGEEELFGTGKDALYHEADERLSFEQRAAGYAVTLQMVQDGNLSSRKLMRDSF